MPNEQPLVFIDLTPEYQKSLRELSKRFRNIRSDIQPIIEQLQQGNFAGDRIAGFGEEYMFTKPESATVTFKKVKVLVID